MSELSLHDEAVRQLTVCNACRYCEGYCNAFKAITRYRSFDQPTVSHLPTFVTTAAGAITPVSTLSHTNSP